MNETENLKVVSNAWLLAWALAYLATAFFAPGIAGDVLAGKILYTTVGWLLIAALTLCSVKVSKDLPLPEGKHMTIKVYKYRNYGRAILFFLALFEVFGAISSWTGLFVWNVPFQAKEIFQVTMGLMDFLGAVFMLIRVMLEVEA